MSEADDSREEARQTWQYRLVEHLRGNQTLLGSVVIAILGKAPSNPPRVLSGGVITEEGILITTFEARAQPGIASVAILGPVDEVRDTYRAICDTLKFDDHDRSAFFEEFRKWVIKDHRAPQVLH